MTEGGDRRCVQQWMVAGEVAGIGADGQTTRGGSGTG